jgi:hypothetical protein
MEQPESVRLSEILIAPEKPADKPAAEKPADNAHLPQRRTRSAESATNDADKQAAMLQL